MEIRRTSLWGFYCRKDAPWTQIKTDWEHLWSLKIIKSWRLHFSKQKISTIGQAIWTSFSYYLFRKNIFFWLNPKNIQRKVVSNHLSKVNLMITLLPKLTWTLSISPFFYVEVSLKYYSSPLNMQNKTSSRTTLLRSFFIWSLWRHRETSKPLRKVELKCNSTIVVLKTNTQAFYR